MSDTPRTDAAGKMVIPSGGGVRMIQPSPDENPWVVPFAFAQELEMELNALKASNLKIMDLEAFELVQKVNQLLRENEELRAENTRFFKAGTQQWAEFRKRKQEYADEIVCLREDKERLNWLDGQRANQSWRYTKSTNDTREGLVLITDGRICTARVAIDAARKAVQP